MDKNELNNPPAVELEYASKTQPPVDRVWVMPRQVVRQLKRLSLGALIILGICGLLLCFKDLLIIQEFFLHLKPWARGVILSLPVLGVVLLFNVAYGLLKWRRNVAGIAILLVWFVLIYLIYSGIVVFRESQWREKARLTTADGKNYRLYARDLSDKDGGLLMTINNDSGWLYNSFDIASVANSLKMHYVLVMPESQHPMKDFTLCQAPGGEICGADPFHRIAVAYNPKTRIASSTDDCSITPFILVDDTTPIVVPRDPGTMLDSDLVYINSATMRKHIKAALSHPNPEVRESVSDLMRLEPKEERSPTTQNVEEP